VITTESGDVAMQPTTRIRGVSSLAGSSEPFVVIDGVPGMFLNAVAPQDIESISVLKDAAASAIYGSRSASGVILITTKKAKADHNEIQTSNYVAIEKVSKKPDVLTAQEWRNYTAANNMDTAGLDFKANTNWFNEIMRTAFSKNHSVSLSGSSQKSNYRTSINYWDRQGIMKDNEVKKLIGLFSGSHTALDGRLHVTITGGITHMNFTWSNETNLALAYNILPVYPIKDEDGNWFERPEFFGHWDQGNPVHNVQASVRNNKMTKLYAIGKAKMNITKGLTAGTTLLKQRLNLATGSYGAIGSQQGRDDHGFALRLDQILDRSLMELTGEYEWKFNQHSFRILAGYSYEDNSYENLGAVSRDFISDRFLYNNLTAGRTLFAGDAFSYQELAKYISFFGRLNYNYKSKYNIEASVRREGSSKFGANNKWGTFPSISAAWFVSDEPFMSPTKLFTTLKLRTGYGVVGNQDGFGPYGSIAKLSPGDQFFDNGEWKKSYSFSQNANPDLKWEQTSTLNVGVDFTITSGRISGAVDYYIKKTRDLLSWYEVPVPPNLYHSTLANVGSLNNKGIEITINTDNVRAKLFSWSSSIIFAQNKNKVTRLSNEKYHSGSLKTGFISEEFPSTHIIEEGRELGTFYGWQSKGIDENGEFVIVDQNKDNKINGLDNTYIGHAFPRFTYSIYNVISYKRLNFSFLLRGSYGNDVLNNARMRYSTVIALPEINVLKEALTSGIRSAPTYSDYFVEDGSFFRFDNANLSYDVNTKRLHGIKVARIYLNAQNLFLITSFKGLDPEVAIGGDAPGVMQTYFVPKPRTFSFGIDLTL
jgi:iron complex outermembrane receptor protein